MRKELTEPSWLAWLVIATIMAFGVYLRVSGIQSDFPFLYDPDEPTFIDPAVRLLSRNSLDPGWYGHPGQFTIYLLAASYKALFFFSKISGTTQDLHSFLERYQYDPTGFYYVGRLLSASFSVGVLILVALIARRLSSQWPTTALAVLLVSISPVLIAYGYLVRPDNQMAFFALIVCFFAIRITEEPRLAYYVYAGLALGVAVSCKYPAVVFAIAIIAAHTMVYRGRFWRRWSDVALSGAVAVVAAFLTAPYLFLNPRGMLRDVLGEARDYHLSATASGPLDATFWYFDEVLQPSAGYVGVILFLIAAAAALRLAKGRGVLAITAIAFFFFIVNLSLHWTRWLIPFMPLYLSLVALGVQDIASWVAEVSGRMSIAVAAGMALCVGVLAAPLGALWGELTDKKEDSRTVAFNWIVANVPESSGILLEMYSPQLPGEKYKLWEVSPEGVLVPVVSSRRFVLTGWTTVGALADLREIEVKDVDFIALSDWYDRYKAEPERYPDELARYEELMRKYPLIFQIGRVKVLRIK